MSYNEALDAIVTKQQAIREIHRHSASAEEFFAEVGEKDSYIGHEILNFLGY